MAVQKKGHPDQNFGQSMKDGFNKLVDAISQSMAKKTRDFLNKHLNAKLIIVTGEAGAGKSSFLNCVTGSDLIISATTVAGEYHSTLRLLEQVDQPFQGTTRIALVPTVIDGQKYLFMDMPGFNIASHDDCEIFQRLMVGIATVFEFVKFRGVIHIDSLKDIRETPAVQKILTWLWLFCGKQFCPNITIVTTKWDRYNKRGICSKLQELQHWQDNDLYRRLTFDVDIDRATNRAIKGAIIWHHGLVFDDKGEPDTLDLNEDENERRRRARRMIHERYHDKTPLTLQVYDEIKAGALPEMTRAGRYLRRVQETGRIQLEDGDDADFVDASENSAFEIPDQGTRPAGAVPESASWFTPGLIRPWLGVAIDVARAYRSWSEGDPNSRWSYDSPDTGFAGANPAFDASFPDPENVDSGFDEDEFEERTSRSWCVIL